MGVTLLEGDLGIGVDRAGDGVDPVAVHGEGSELGVCGEEILAGGGVIGHETILP